MVQSQQGQVRAVGAISVTAHEQLLRGFPCLISEMTPVTLHHCHGGSIKDNGWHVGMGQRQNPFLQIPIHERFHTGNFGIDSGYGVLSWEKDFGTQWSYLAELDRILPYDLLIQATWWEEKHRIKSAERSTRTKRFTTTE